MLKHAAWCGSLDPLAPHVSEKENSQLASHILFFTHARQASIGHVTIKYVASSLNYTLI